MSEQLTSTEVTLDLQDFNMRLEEARETLFALRMGEVDALVVRTGSGDQVQTMRSADYVYHLLFEQLNEGALTLSGEGVILYCNSRFAQMMGVPLDQVLGTPVQRYALPADRETLEQLLAQGLQQRARAEISLLSPCAADGEVRALVSVSPVDAQIVSACVIAVVTDVTDLRRAQRELQDAMDALEMRVAERTSDFATANRALQAEIEGRVGLELALRRKADELTEADQRKDRFLATLAHELRNPLAPISNALILLQRGLNEPQQQQWACAVIERQVRQLTRLVDDLLDVSRIGRGKVQLQCDEVDLKSIVANALEVSRPQLEERGQTLHLELAAEPLKVFGDRLRLAQVVINLLNNAAKFTPAGGNIWLHAAREGNELVVRVRDDGQGIEPSMLVRIFEVFTQADAGNERSRGGLGIGLALVRSLVELHGGRVEAHSAGPGQGSEFVMRLPAC